MTVILHLYFKEGCEKENCVRYFNIDRPDETSARNFAKGFFGNDSYVERKESSVENLDDWLRTTPYSFFIENVCATTMD